MEVGLTKGGKGGRIIGSEIRLEELGERSKLSRCTGQRGTLRGMLAKWTHTSEPRALGTARAKTAMGARGKVNSDGPVSDSGCPMGVLSSMRRNRVLSNHVLRRGVAIAVEQSVGRLMGETIR